MTKSWPYLRCLLTNCPSSRKKSGSALHRADERIDSFHQFVSSQKRRQRSCKCSKKNRFSMADSLSFPYILEPEAIDDQVARPFIPVIISFHGKAIDTMALLDSGADISILPYEMGKAVGADWSRQPALWHLEGFGGEFETKKLVADLVIGAWRPLRIIFGWTRSNDVPLFLGQLNFFHLVEICFYRSRDLVQLSLAQTG